MRGRIALLALAVCAASVGVGGASGGNVVTPAHPTVTWAGHVAAPGAPPPVHGALCEAGACHEFAFNVAMGDAWGTPRGSLEIAIRWAPYDFETDLDLYVFDADGVPVAQAAGVDSNGESVFLAAPPDGAYVARVVASSVADEEGEDFEGLVQVEPAPAGTGDRLPNLVALPPYDFHIATGANLLPVPENPLVSCYAEETVEDPAHPTRCLRFNQAIGNAGAGPLELAFAMQNAASQTEAERLLLQRIYDAEGTFREEPVDSYELHLAHGHVHYRGFGQSKLYPYVWGEGRAGEGVPARIGNKVGFCLIDVVMLDDYWTEPGNGARNYTFPGCNVPRELDDEGNVWMVMGVDVGWADVYNWHLADQYIDITGLANGLYEIEQLANPNALDGDEDTPHVVESSYDDNRASTIICIDEDSATPVTTEAEAEDCA